jgi:hypothetical protein
MADGRIAGGVPRDISSLDEDAISPQPLESRSDVGLPDRATSTSTSDQPALARHPAISNGTAAAFAKLPIEVIELYGPPDS